ncbi:MAG: hypothetical protein CXR30_06400 [Geobacter sp.]|nr:MAG: hypothetical protein CXR30_06400 [Geobacter sp.]
MKLRCLFIGGKVLICLLQIGLVSAFAISVTVSPTTLSFGSQPLYTASNSQSVTITNYLGSSISLSGLAISGDFSKVNSSTCGTSLSANSSCHIDVVFIPTATGQRTGSISITGISASVSLSGDGIIDTSAPTAVLSALTTITNSQGFTLNGSRSFDIGGGTIATYRWTSLDASTANMSVNVPVLTTSPTFNVVILPDQPLALGSHAFRLEVVDTSGNVSAPATVNVTVIDTSAPTAVLSAPTTISNSQEFTLNGSRSFDVGGGTIATYRWTSLDASTANMSLNMPVLTTSPTLNVVISPDQPLPLGSHAFRLEVVDTSGNVSSPATVSVTAVDQSAPTAVLSAPTLVPYGQGFILDGRKSFDVGGGTIATYRWTSLDTATGNMAVNVPVDTTTPTFTVTVAPDNPPALGNRRFQLQVVDTSGNVSLPTIVYVTVVDLVAPTAVLSAPPTVPANQNIVLSGSKSFDAGGGTIATYRWTSLGADVGNMVANVPVDTTAPTFTVTVSPNNLLALGSHTFQLQVVDTSGNVSQPATVNVSVVAPVTKYLSVAFSGTGGTTITSAPAGIICQAGLPNDNCNAAFNLGTAVMLTATADGVSELTGWSNADTTTGNPVNVTMDGDKTVTAVFAPIQAPVLIYGAHGYPSLAQALAAVTGNCTIMIQSSYNDSAVQSLNFNNGFRIELAGGRNGSWDPGAGVSKLKGAMTVSSGEVVVQGIALTP